MSDNLNTIGIRGKIAARTPDYRYTLPEGGNPGDIPVKTETGVEWQQPEPAVTTPDWSQNDETASDYIKNRPGGYDGSKNFKLTYDYYWDSITFDEHSLVFDVSGEEDLTPGRAVSVTIGGVAHQTELRLFDADNLKFYVGNMALSEKFNGPGGDDTGETFCVCFELRFVDYACYVSTIRANITDIGENDTTLSTPLILATEPCMIPQEYLSSVGRFYTVDGEKRGEIFNCNLDANWWPNIASGDYSHAEGYYTTASGDYSHAEGYYTTASGSYSHAEGNDTTASGYYSHAEGIDSVASGSCSHAEGYSLASGSHSHAEGRQTEASGSCSHAEGLNNIASGDYSHVQGKYNVADAAEKYAHIVGNGTSNTKRSNAHTLDWSGNAWYAGTVEGAAMIVKSSTSGSAKKFKITVDDSGTLSATEVTT